MPVGVAVPAAARRDEEERRPRIRPVGELERAASGGRSLPLAPTTIAPPSTSRAVETTEPAIEPRTTFGRPSLIAKSAMISSGALPKLALRKPPMPGPVCSATCLGRLADQERERRERASAARMKTTVSLAWKRVAGDEHDRGEREAMPSRESSAPRCQE